MKALWRYRCDFGHSWDFVREDDAESRPDDSICPFGHEAVMLQKEVFLDVIQIGFRSAARMVDAVRGQTDGEYRFNLVLTDVHMGKERLSQSTYTWQKIKELADLFRGLSAEKAFQLMEKKNL